jgi:hypothetical protein
LFGVSLLILNLFFNKLVIFDWILVESGIVRG